jgi:hypothetical protein
VDEIEGDTIRARNAGEDLTDDDDFRNVDRRNDAGEDEAEGTVAGDSDNNPRRGAAIDYNMKAEDARPDTNADLTDPGAQESGLDIGF